ncbi:MAG: hypothetical protein ACXVHO_06235 [Methanobacterium sp.]
MEEIDPVWFSLYPCATKVTVIVSLVDPLGSIAPRVSTLIPLSPVLLFNASETASTLVTLTVFTTGDLPEPVILSQSAVNLDTCISMSFPTSGGCAVTMV